MYKLLRKFKYKEEVDKEREPGPKKEDSKMKRHDGYEFILSGQKDFDETKFDNFKQIEEQEPDR